MSIALATAVLCPLHVKGGIEHWEIGTSAYILPWAPSSHNKNSVFLHI